MQYQRVISKDAPSVVIYLIDDYSLPKNGNIVAAYDLDDTLIISRIDSKYLLRFDDLLPNNCVIRPPDNAKIMIFSNQSRYNDVLFVKKLEIAYKLFNRRPFIAFAARKKDLFRKPAPGMFALAIGNVVFDKVNSYYCGDAAGDIGDFSDSDLQFAQNCQINFIKRTRPNKNPPNTIFMDIKTVILVLGQIDTQKFKDFGIIYWPNKDKFYEFLHMGRSIVFVNAPKLFIDRYEYLSYAKQFKYFTQIIYSTTNNNIIGMEIPSPLECDNLISL